MSISTKQRTLLTFLSRSSSLKFLAAILTLFALAFTAACGSGGSMTKTPPPLSGNTQVTVVLSSAANDQLTQFYLQFESLTLTSQSGKTVTVFSSPSEEQATRFGELMHVNGLINPMLTLSVPQDIYTSATATIGYAQFTCVTIDPSGGLYSSTMAYGQTPTANVTVNLPSPITVTGNSMGLQLALQVSQSASYGSCYQNGLVQYSITPTFSLTPLAVASHPANSATGRVLGLTGEITALGASGNSLSLSLPVQEGSRVVSVSAGSGTVYQGISNFSSLAVGTFLEMDGAMQPDGSLQATRIAVADPSAVIVMSGPLLQVASSVPVLGFYGIEQQGTGAANSIGAELLNFSNAAFNVSGELSNLQSLPFVPGFSASNMVAGQNVYVTSPGLITSGGQYTPLHTITLIPQTINGTIVGTSTTGNFTDYTIALAPYDVFPTFAEQAGQTTLLKNPGVVEVYVDHNTQLLNKMALNANATMRFFGLVFNDNGTLRMDCAQVSDGVSTSPQAAKENSLVTGKMRITRRDGTLQQTIAVSVH